MIYWRVKSQDLVQSQKLSN